LTALQTALHKAAVETSTRNGNCGSNLRTKGPMTSTGPQTVASNLCLNSYLPHYPRDSFSRYDALL
jgi:hypothetical protein